LTKQKLMMKSNHKLDDKTKLVKIQLRTVLAVRMLQIENINCTHSDSTLAVATGV